MFQNKIVISNASLVSAYPESFAALFAALCLCRKVQIARQEDLFEKKAKKRG